MHLKMKQQGGKEEGYCECGFGVNGSGESRDCGVVGCMLIGGGVLKV